MDPRKPTLLARLKYEGQSQQPLRDLHTFGDRATSAEDFLHQFISFEASSSDHPLVREYYGSAAQQIISSAAIFQLNWLPKPGSKGLGVESHLIMLSLHCLIATIELAELTLSHNGSMELPTPVPYRIGGAYIRAEFKEVTDPSKWPQDPPGKYPLVRTLQRVTQSAYRMLLRGDARDWPAFYYTYFILNRIAWNLQIPQKLTTAFRGAASKFDDDIEGKLCGFAKYVTEGNELYYSTFDINKYKLLVSDPRLREECVHLNKLWTAPLDDWEQSHVIS